MLLRDTAALLITHVPNKLMLPLPSVKCADRSHDLVKTSSPGHPCPTWDSTNGQSLLGAPAGLAQPFSEPSCALRLFLPRLPSPSPFPGVRPASWSEGSAYSVLLPLSSTSTEVCSNKSIHALLIPSQCWLCGSIKLTEPLRPDAGGAQVRDGTSAPRGQTGGRGRGGERGSSQITKSTPVWCSHLGLTPLCLSFIP